MKINANDLKIGNIIQHNKSLWKVAKLSHTQPGKGGAYIQAELKEIKEGTKMNSRFRSSETIEKAFLDEKKFQYLYSENENFFFMDQQTYEQLELGQDVVSEDQTKYLIENDDVIIQFYNEKPVSLQLQEQVVLTVLETEGVVKGQTAASSYKPAVLEKGIKTTVPQFIEVNDKIVVSTIDDTYIEKAK